jgi:hypothetical protein
MARRHRSVTTEGALMTVGDEIFLGKLFSIVRRVQSVLHRT